MRLLIPVAGLLFFAVGELPAQANPDWTRMCAGAAPAPESIFEGYEPCDLVLPQSITLTTTPRTGQSIGWIYGQSPQGETLMIATEMPSRPDTLTVKLVAAYCSESRKLPTFVVKCGSNHAGVFGHIPGALLTDSLIAEGVTEAFIRMRTEEGELVPARFVGRHDTDDPRPAILAFDADSP